MTPPQLRRSAAARSLLALAAITSMAVAPTGAADAGSTDATSFYAVKRAVLPGDPFTVDCEEPEGAENATLLVMYVLHSGSWISNGLGWATFGAHDPAVTITAAGNAQTVPLPSTGIEPERPPSFRGTASGNQTLRVAWASWGADMQCSVTVNGIAVPAQPLPDADAMMARVQHFEGVASADADLAGAGVGLTHEREVDGYVFTWFYVTHGSRTHRGPNNENGGDAATFWPGDSTGTWTYGLTGASAPGSPRAFMMEVPR